MAGESIEVIVERLAQLEKRMNERFDAITREMHASFLSAARAIDKADSATERRFEGVNEFRAQLSDQASRFVTREELAGLEDKLIGLIERNRSDVEQLSKKLS